MSGFDGSEKRLLDAVAPPPMSPEFADRVMAALPPSELSRAKRDRRGGWTRGRGALVGAIAAGLLSVGAAASGLLGGRVQQLPVIATIAQAVEATPSAPPKPAPQRSAAAAGRGVTPRREAAEPVATPRDAQREAIAQHIADRIEQREARRVALGLPPVDPLIRRAARARLQQLPPEERRALVERVREIRTERGMNTPPLPFETRAERRARWREMRENFTPEQRERLREWRERRRAMRGEIAPEPAE